MSNPNNNSIIAKLNKKMEPTVNYLLELPENMNDELNSLMGPTIRDYKKLGAKISLDDTNDPVGNSNNLVGVGTNNLVGVSKGGIIKPFFNMVLESNFQTYILLFISIATVIIIALSLTIKYDKKLSASSTASIILTLSCFVFAVSVIGYLYYLNNVIGNPTGINMDKMKALRNTNIVYLMMMLGGIFMFYVGDYQDTMRNNQINTMIVTSVFSFLYLMYARRYKYNNITTEFFKTLGFAFMIALFTYNPYNITPKLTGVNISFIMMAIIFFIVMITYYNGIFTDANIFKFDNVTDGLKKMFFIIFSIIISIGVIVLILSSFNAFNPHDASTGSYLLNVAIIVGMLSILYNVLDSTGFLKNHPLFRLIVASTLYIPCLFTNILETILKEYYQTTNFSIVLLAIEAILILIHIYYPTIVKMIYTSSGGMRIINDPIDLSSEKIVSYYETLTGNNIVDVIKNPNIPDIKVGNDVQVKQNEPKIEIIGYLNKYKGTIITIHNDKRNDLYDIHYEIDGTYQYNVLKRDIVTNGPLLLGGKVEVIRKWIAGTITHINFDGSYNIEYKTSFSDTKKEVLKKTAEVAFVAKNVAPSDIQLINESKLDKNTYKFAMSFWIFINSMPPNTNANYNKYTSLLNYSNNPNVMYNPSKNDFIISVNQNIESPNPATDINSDTNGEVHNVIYTNKNMPLQKWNNIVINYDSGIMDIFLNGELVQSSNKIVPNIKYHELKVGSNNGIKAGLCNLVYFNKPLSIIEINNSYNVTKTKGIPKVPEGSLFSFSFSS